MRLHKSWHEKLIDEIKKPYIVELKNFLATEKEQKRVVYPPEDLVFNAFSQTPYERVKVVIVGQDPYHGPGQAHGLSFSVLPGISQPPSLKNIFKELHADLGIEIPNSGCLTSWAQEGVLLLNATLTVRASEPKSHHGRGWELFTDGVIDLLSKKENPIVFLLWGKSAKEKCSKIAGTHHAIYEAAHPSPYSANGFFGCRHFSKTNDFLIKTGQQPVNWAVR